MWPVVRRAGRDVGHEFEVVLEGSVGGVPELYIDARRGRRKRIVGIEFYGNLEDLTVCPPRTDVALRLVPPKQNRMRLYGCIDNVAILPGVKQLWPSLSSCPGMDLNKWTASGTSWPATVPGPSRAASCLSKACFGLNSTSTSSSRGAPPAVGVSERTERFGNMKF
eukprot:5886270-Prymnesium_polylepis.1